MTEGSKKRKRPNPNNHKIKETSSKEQSRVSQSLLSSYYPLVLSLRDYLSLILPLSDPHLIFPPSSSNSQQDQQYLTLAQSLIAIDEVEAQTVKPLRDASSSDLNKGKWSNWKPPAPDSSETDSDTLLQVS